MKRSHMNFCKECRKAFELKNNLDYCEKCRIMLDIPRNGYSELQLQMDIPTETIWNKENKEISRELQYLINIET